jgi:hypothetical protein
MKLIAPIARGDFQITLIYADEAVPFPTIKVSSASTVSRKSKIAIGYLKVSLPENRST